MQGLAFGRPLHSISWMSVVAKASRTQLWLESLGDWSWPGQGGAAAEALLPPSWVPTFPPLRQPAVDGSTLPVSWTPERSPARRLLTGALLSLLMATFLALGQGGQLTLRGILGLSNASAGEQEAPAIRSAPAAQSLPTLDAVSRAASGSMIVGSRYTSAALHGEGSFLVYLPPGYESTTAHYPVLYMLPGDEQPDRAFLQIGLQQQLDELIARHAMPPLIAVMIEGGPGANLWRNQGSLRYESYVLEVQELIDRMLPTVPSREARAIVGDSMGGYGAMNIALSNPYRFGVVESWIGFFNGLEGQLRADRPVFSRLGLHAFVYGAEQDRIANPAEDLPFAAALRAAGADADGAIYAGEHSLETVEAHLASMLSFAGRALRSAQIPAAG